MDAVLYQDERKRYATLKNCYRAIDPDNELGCRVESETLVDEMQRMASKRLDQGLIAAGFTSISEAELQAATGIVSRWGVPLRVDFELFEILAMYSRGDVMGVRLLRPWSRPWRQDPVDVRLYQRVAIVFRLKQPLRGEEHLDPDCLHVRMYKNIPKTDIDMLLPGSQVRLTWLDGTKIIMPSLGSIGMTIWRIIRTAILVAAISMYTAVMIAGLLLLTVVYVARAVFSYFQTRHKHMLNLTRSLYYQKIESNAGVIYSVLEDARQQRHAAQLLACYAFAMESNPLSRRRLKRRVERIIRELTAIEVDFQVDDVLEDMSRFGLINWIEREQRWQMLTLEQALATLHQWWDAQPLEINSITTDDRGG